MDNDDEAGHPRASTTISIHYKCETIKTASKRYSLHVGFFFLRKKIPSICCLKRDMPMPTNNPLLREPRSNGIPEAMSTPSPDLGF